MSEDARMSLFDAAALALTFFQSPQEGRNRPRDPQFCHPVPVANGAGSETEDMSRSFFTS
jgi:hypothetical protein